MPTKTRREEEVVRRTFAKILLASAVAAATGNALAAEDTIKIGVSGPKSGAQSGGAAAVFWPTIQLWMHDLKEKGGIDVGGKKLQVELVEYDDQTSPEVAIK